MSCLTRELKNDLKKFLIRHRQNVQGQNYSSRRLRQVLVNTGLCPSTLTDDQLKSVVSEAFADDSRLEHSIF